MIRANVVKCFASPLASIQILRRLQNLSSDLDLRFLSLNDLAKSISDGIYPNITTSEIDTLASETAASRSTSHPDYARLAAMICISANHRRTPNTFSEAMIILNRGGDGDGMDGDVVTREGGGGGFVSDDIADLVRRRGREIDERIQSERDLEMSYFGFKTLERSYLLKLNENTIVERPQYMWMRVALGIHCCKYRGFVSEGGYEDVEKIIGDNSESPNKIIDKEEEDANLEAAFETYDLMSRGYFTHASPTLFHAGTTHPQLCSCFLVQMSDDSISGIYDTLKRCAVISKVS